MVVRWKHIIKWMSYIAVIYMAQYFIYFFYADPDLSLPPVILTIKLFLVATCTFIFWFGFFSLIHEFRSGGWRAICRKIKELLNEQ